MSRTGVLSDDSIRFTNAAFFPNKRNKFKTPYYDLFNHVQFGQDTRTGSLSARANLVIESYQSQPEIKEQATSSRTRGLLQMTHSKETPFQIELGIAKFEEDNPNLAQTNIPDETKAFLGFTGIDPDRVLFSRDLKRHGGMQFFHNSLEEVKKRAESFTFGKQDYDDVINAIEEYNDAQPKYPHIDGLRNMMSDFGLGTLNLDDNE